MITRTLTWVELKPGGFCAVTEQGIRFIIRDHVKEHGDYAFTIMAPHHNRYQLGSETFLRTKTKYEAMMLAEGFVLGWRLAGGPCIKLGSFRCWQCGEEIVGALSMSPPTCLNCGGIPAVKGKPV